MNNKYLTGPEITIADSCVAIVLTLLEWSNFNFKMWPKLESWLKRIKQHPFWDDVHVSHNVHVKEIQRSSMTFD
jgi:glutathione S-transferase